MANTLGPAKVVFACVANAGRSQMAAALFNTLASPASARAVSAGTKPGTTVHPEVVTAMRELGIDISAAKPQYLSTDITKDAHIVITMGCGDDCPLIPGVERDDWPLADPQGQPLETVRQIREEIRKRVTELVSERKWT